MAGRTATYDVTAFNVVGPAAAEVSQTNWRVESGGKPLAEFRSVGDMLDFDAPVSLIGKTITVMPFRNSPTPDVSVVSSVVDAESVNEAFRNVIVVPRTEWGARLELPRLGNLVDRRVCTKVFIHSHRYCRSELNS